MKLLDKIIEARSVARTNKDTVKAELLGVLIGDCTRSTKTPSDEDVIKIVKKFINNAQQTLTDAEERNHPRLGEISASVITEVGILSEYVPKQLTEEDIVAEITKAKASGYTSIQTLMGYFKTNFAGLYDGKLVSDLVKASL